LEGRIGLLEDGLEAALKLVITLAKKVTKEAGIEVDDSFLEKLEELNTLESVIDIIKFIESDSDSLLLQCAKI
jgi:hypothetical protein